MLAVLPVVFILVVLDCSLKKKNLHPIIWAHMVCATSADLFVLTTCHQSRDGDVFTTHLAFSFFFFFFQFNFKLKSCSSLINTFNKNRFLLAWRTGTTWRSIKQVNDTDWSTTTVITDLHHDCRAWQQPHLEYVCSCRYPLPFNYSDRLHIVETRVL